MVPMMARAHEAYLAFTRCASSIADSEGLPVAMLRTTPDSAARRSACWTRSLGISKKPGSASTLKAVFTHRHLTVFAGTRPVLVNLLWLVYALTLALVLVYADGPDGSMQPTYLHALRIGDGAVLEFRVLSAFVLGGFVLLVVDAWQTRRGNYSSLVSSAKTFLIHVGSSLPLTQPRAGNSREQPNDLQVSLCAPAPAAIRAR